MAADTKKATTTYYAAAALAIYFLKKFAENSPLLVWEMNRRFCFPRFVCIILYVS